MNFKVPQLEEELPGSHPDLIDVLRAFDKWCFDEHLPEPIITALWREIGFYKKHGLKPNPHSWHLFRCAVDLRLSHYDAMAKEKVLAWWQEKLVDRKDKKGPKAKWELYTETHGTGPHIHVGRRDYAWKEKYRG